MLRHVCALTQAPSSMHACTVTCQGSCILVKEIKKLSDNRSVTFKGQPCFTRDCQQDINILCLVGHTKAETYISYSDHLNFADEKLAQLIDITWKLYFPKYFELEVIKLNQHFQDQKTHLASHWGNIYFSCYFTYQAMGHRSGHYQIRIWQHSQLYIHMR